MKRIAQALRGAFFQRFNLHLPEIVAALPTELPVLEVRAQRTDLLFLLADGTILHLEFQTTTKPEDIGRFASYNLAAHLHFGRPVHTVVLYGPGITAAPESLGGASLTFTAQNIYVGAQDGAATLQRLRDKETRGEDLSVTDRVDIILMPLMRNAEPVPAVAIAAAQIAQRLPSEARDETIGAMVGLAYHYMEEEIANGILEVLVGMNLLDTLLEEREARGEARGLAEGELKARRADVRELLLLRFGPIPASLQERIDTADLATLTDLFARAAVAQSLTDIEQA
ncbi:MAG TPA: hypothetical protein VFE42_15665 [Chloroflexota bacterium]|nr:hypothetical protein [Chloroflexota bacterium]